MKDDRAQTIDAAIELIRDEIKAMRAAQLEDGSLTAEDRRGLRDLSAALVALGKERPPEPPDDRSLDERIAAGEKALEELRAKRDRDAATVEAPAPERQKRVRAIDANPRAKQRIEFADGEDEA